MILLKLAIKFVRSYYPARSIIVKKNATKVSAKNAQKPSQIIVVVRQPNTKFCVQKEKKSSWSAQNPAIQRKFAENIGATKFAAS